MPGSHIEVENRDRPAGFRKDHHASGEIARPGGGAAGPRAKLEDGATPPIYFYYPRGIGDGDIPESRGEFARNRPGNYIWTVKTFGYLSKLGFPCRLVHELPDEGIILTHREFFTDGMVPNGRQLFVCLVADFQRHPFAQLHVVQNPSDPLLKDASPAWPAAFMPHWPETGLIPRDPARGDAFVNVSYYGLPARLAPQLRSEEFAARLREHGFNFRIVGRDRWNDYSDTDAVLAVRSFAPVSWHKFPPTKLYNCWLAGVPGLLGAESAYQAERRNEYDFFEVRSADEVLQTLIRLRDDPRLRAAVARNCAERAAGVDSMRIAETWAAFLTQVAVPAWREWQRRSSPGRLGFRVARSLSYLQFVSTDFVMRGVSFVRKKVRALSP
jgi:hypothetical protein